MLSKIKLIIITILKRLLVSPRFEIVSKTLISDHKWRNTFTNYTALEHNMFCAFISVAIQHFSSLYFEKPLARFASPGMQRNIGCSF